MKIGDKVKYIGVRHKDIIGQIGIITSTHTESPEELRADEYTVDFGYEDDCEYYLREKQLELFSKSQPTEPLFKKPPLGLKPDYIWREQLIDLHAKERIIEISEAIKRYLDAGLQVNSAWVLEYNTLVSRAEKEE